MRLSSEPARPAKRHRCNRHLVVGGDKETDADAEQRIGDGVEKMVILDPSKSANSSATAKTLSAMPAGPTQRTPIRSFTVLLNGAVIPMATGMMAMQADLTGVPRRSRVPARRI